MAWQSEKFWPRDGRSPDVVERCAPWRSRVFVGEAIYVGMAELVAWTGGCSHLLTSPGLPAGRCLGRRAEISGWGVGVCGREESALHTKRKRVNNARDWNNGWLQKYF